MYDCCAQCDWCTPGNRWAKSETQFVEVKADNSTLLVQSSNVVSCSAA